MKLIGTGAFTKVYKLNEKEVVMKSNDPVKEAMACGCFPKSKLFPNIDFYEGDDDFDYISKYDKNLKNRTVISNLNPYYQNMYRELKKLQKTKTAKEFIKTLKSLNGIYRYHKDAILNAFTGIVNFVDPDDIRFEISSRNVSTRNGKLILNDCFFSERELYKGRAF